MQPWPFLHLSSLRLLWVSAIHRELCEADRLFLRSFQLEQLLSRQKVQLANLRFCHLCLLVPMPTAWLTAAAWLLQPSKSLATKSCVLSLYLVRQGFQMYKLRQQMPAVARGFVQPPHTICSALGELEDTSCWDRAEAEHGSSIP